MAARSRLILLISIVLVLILIAVVWAFNTFILPAIPPAPGPEPSPEVEVNLPESMSTAARITQRGTLRVGVKFDLPPFGFSSAEGQIVGFDVDIAREFAENT